MTESFGVGRSNCKVSMNIDKVISEFLEKNEFSDSAQRTRIKKIKLV